MEKKPEQWVAQIDTRSRVTTGNCPKKGDACTMTIEDIRIVAGGTTAMMSQ
jgi:hypothetical protein